MAKKTVKMTLSKNGYSKFKRAMKIMKFKDENHFLKYCCLKTIKPKLTKNQQEMVKKEIKLLQEAQK